MSLPVPPNPTSPSPAAVSLINPQTAAMERKVEMTAASAKSKVVGSSKLLQRMAVDVTSAGVATLLIAPVICLIDRSIMENASGKTKSVFESASNTFRMLLTKPHRFFFSKPFALIYMTYGGTYLTANLLDTFSSTRNGTPIATQTSGTPKFVATSTANMGLGLIKDRTFARLFGTGSPRPVPFPSFLLFSARDALTIAFSFNIPPRLAPFLPEAKSWKRESAAQFLAPAVCQLLTTPLHLTGLDLYNREGRLGWAERMKQVGRNYWASTGARVCRIVPAFGVGGVANTKVRRSLMGGIETA